MSEINYYQVLQISVEADAKAIQNAYRRLARQYHPDAGTMESSEEAMKLLNQAYGVLSDSEKRRIYDRKHFGRSSEPRSTPSDRPSPGAAFREGVLQVSNFKHHDPNWLEVDLDWAKTFQRDGFYYISVLQPSFERYAYPARWVVKNFVISVDVQLIEFAQTTEIGFVYRGKQQGDEERYHRISLSPDGICSGLQVQIKHQRITDYQQFFSYRSPNKLRCDRHETNTLKFRVINTYAEISLNNQIVTTFDNVNPEQGFAGLSVRHRGGIPAVTARFTNFRLAAIE